MLTKMSLWGIYFASYLVDYGLILIILICKRFVFCRNKAVPFWAGEDILVWCIVLGFIVISILITGQIKHIRMNTRVKLVPEKNITHDMIGYILPQIVTVATTLFTDWWILANCVLFLVFGFFFVGSGKVYTSPLFVIPLGNKIYESGDSIIITRYSMQNMRIEQEDIADGLEARELMENVYYVRKP